jgi:hypothetical protein
MMAESFELANAVLAPTDAMRRAFREEWRHLADPGTWWSGAQRIAIVGAGRDAVAASAATGSDLPDLVVEVARTIAGAAHSIDAALVDGFVASGLEREPYTEIVGIVARSTAIDTAVRGLGGSIEPLPQPNAGQPSQLFVADAKKRSGFVPMTGAASPVNALSGVAAEDVAQRALHASLYLSYEEMGDLLIEKGLSRAQLELVAARTSLLNDCFF